MFFSSSSISSTIPIAVGPFKAATLIVSGKLTSVVEELVELDELSVVELELLEELSAEELELLEELVELVEELVEPPEQAVKVSAQIAVIKTALNLFLIFIEYLLSFAG